MFSYPFVDIELLRAVAAFDAPHNAIFVLLLEAIAVEKIEPRPRACDLLVLPLTVADWTKVYCTEWENGAPRLCRRDETLTNHINLFQRESNYFHDVPM